MGCTTPNFISTTKSQEVEVSYTVSYSGGVTGKTFKERIDKLFILCHPSLHPFIEKTVKTCLIFKKFIIINWVLKGGIYKISETYKIVKFLDVE